MNTGLLGFPRGGRICFAVGMSVDQTGIAATTHTKINMTAVPQINVGGFWNMSTYRFQPPPGVYWLCTSLLWSAAVADAKYLFAEVVTNGVPNGFPTLQSIQHTSSALAIVSQGSGMFVCKGGEYFEPYIYTNATGPHTVASGVYPTTSFMGFQI